MNRAEDTLRRLLREKSCDQRTLITLDGPCASGKTTMAERFSRLCGAPVIHTDKFVVPHSQKTAERLAIPGGNCDAERLVRETIAPWKSGLPAIVRRYNCKADRMEPDEALAPVPVLILEGSYCNLPKIRQYADIRFFLDIPWETRLERLKERESPASLEQFKNRWIPLEDAYFKAFSLPDEGCVIIRKIDL